MTPFIFTFTDSVIVASQPTHCTSSSSSSCSSPKYAILLPFPFVPLCSLIAARLLSVRPPALVLARPFWSVRPLHLHPRRATCLSALREGRLAQVRQGRRSGGLVSKSKSLMNTDSPRWHWWAGGGKMERGRERERERLWSCTSFGQREKNKGEKKALPTPLQRSQWLNTSACALKAKHYKLTERVGLSLSTVALCDLSSGHFKFLPRVMSFAT